MASSAALSSQASIVSYQFRDGIATIVMDDGKRNVVSPAMLKQLNTALDDAEKDNAVVILTGREGVLSAGFDLKVLKSGGLDALNMLIGGFQLSRRLLSFPSPVVIACPGHAIAMGSFMLLSGDYRIGTRGDFKIVANEVEIGLTVPRSAMEICRQRLATPYLDRSVLLSESCGPDLAVNAGFLDAVADKRELMNLARERASAYLQLDRKAHCTSKLRLRHDMLKRLDAAIRRDQLEFAARGVSALWSRLMP
ncbi:MAG: crotonase/enoyl-CoA hydratase family protein [Ketobacteraceae bacterium]|nr:crotonase/enoyl-CoA hydratase family protein [Ketobacteraceae bacterium]